MTRFRLRLAQLGVLAILVLLMVPTLAACSPGGGDTGGEPASRPGGQWQRWPGRR